MNIVQAAGSVSSARELLSGAFVTHPEHGRVGYARLTDSRSGEVELRYVDTSAEARARTARFTENQVVRLEAFTNGLNALAYPKLGWRKELDGTWVGTIWRNQSYNRGLRPGNNTRVNASNFTRFLSGKYGIRTDLDAATLLRAVYYPEYDTVATLIPRLLSGEALAGVLSPEFAVLPRNSGGWYIIHNAHRVGTIDARGRIQFTVPSSETLWNKVS